MPVVYRCLVWLFSRLTLIIWLLVSDLATAGRFMVREMLPAECSWNRCEQKRLCPEFTLVKSWDYCESRAHAPVMLLNTSINTCYKKFSIHKFMNKDILPLACFIAFNLNLFVYSPQQMTENHTCSWATVTPSQDYHKRFLDSCLCCTQDKYFVQMLHITSNIAVCYAVCCDITV